MSNDPTIPSRPLNDETTVVAGHLYAAVGVERVLSVTIDLPGWVFERVEKVCVLRAYAKWKLTKLAAMVMGIDMKQARQTDPATRAISPSKAIRGARRLGA